MVITDLLLSAGFLKPQRLQRRCQAAAFDVRGLDFLDESAAFHRKHLQPSPGGYNVRTDALLRTWRKYRCATKTFLKSKRRKFGIHWVPGFSGTYSTVVGISWLEFSLRCDYGIVFADSLPILPSLGTWQEVRRATKLFFFLIQIETDC